MIGIYKITSPTNKVYIGQSVNIEKRWETYKRNLGKGQTRLYNSFKKYGLHKHKFEVLCQCNINELNNMERFYQDAFCSISGSGLNCLLTGDDYTSGKISEYSIINMRNGAKNRTVSYEQLKKMWAVNRGRIVSAETRQKMSIAHKGRIVSKESICKQIETRKKNGKVVSKETREKLSTALKGRIISVETRLKMSKTKQKMSDYTKNKLSCNNARRKIVLHLETGVYFESAKIAAKCFNFKYTTFMHMLSGYQINKTNCIYI